MAGQRKKRGRKQQHPQRRLAGEPGSQEAIRRKPSPSPGQGRQSPRPEPGDLPAAQGPPQANRDTAESSKPANRVPDYIDEFTSTPRQRPEEVDTGQLSRLERRRAARIARAAEQMAIRRISTTLDEGERASQHQLEEIAAKGQRAVEARFEEVDSEFTAVLEGALDAVRAEVAEEGRRLATTAEELTGKLEPLVLEQLVPRLTAAIESRFQEREMKPILVAAERELRKRSEATIKEVETRFEQASRELPESSKEREAQLAKLRDQISRGSERIEKANQDLAMQADRQVDRVGGGLERLEVQSSRVQQSAAELRKEGASVRERVVALEEFIKTASNDLTIQIDAAEQELERKLELGAKLREGAEEDREHERERWEQARAKLAEDLQRATRELREHLLVQLAGIKQSADASAGAGAEAPSDEGERWIPEWVPDLGRDQARNDVDLNSAGVTELRALGLSMTQTQRLLRYRELNGPFNSIEELTAIPGLSSEQRAKLKQSLPAR